jgi:hypothetical protein
VSLDQACMHARTGRESFTTVVTACIPQYISKPNLARMLL